MSLHKNNEQEGTEPINYLSFMLRLSKINKAGTWRLTLRGLTGDTIQSFASPDALCHFLQTIISKQNQETQQ